MEHHMYPCSLQFLLFISVGRVTPCSHHDYTVHFLARGVRSQVSADDIYHSLIEFLCWRLLAFSGTTLLFYDYFLTLPLEVRIVRGCAPAQRFKDL